jgi:glyoxylase-like metal-dependent hydrolase (beta-lactamase superfamily II)
MNKGKAIFRVMLGCVVCLLLAATATAPRMLQVDDLDPYIRVDRLGEKVLVIWCEGANYEAVTAIATTKGIVMIDAGLNPPLTAKYRKIIEQEFGRHDFKYVINTHSHQDHIFGDSVFPEAIVVGHENARRELIQHLRDGSIRNNYRAIPQTYSDRLKSVPAHSDAAKNMMIWIYKASEVLANMDQREFVLPLPAIMFNDRLTLDMGDVTFKLFHFGKAHSESDIWVYVPEERLLFTGDMLDASGALPFADCGEANMDRVHAALSEMLAPETGVSRVIIGHRPLNMSLDGLRILEQNVLKIRAAYRAGLRFYDYARIDRILATCGLPGLLAEFEALRTTQQGKFFFVEPEFNRLGYALLGRGKTAEAVVVLKMNAELFPESANVYDSLAEAYLAAGDRELALANYEKSLQLNPQNTNAAEQVKKLKEKRGV